VKQADQTLAPGDIKAGQWVMATYDGANMQMQSQTANAAGSGASTVFGRTGSVSAQTGDYTSAQVTESGNLYFTGARARAAFSGSGPVTLNGATGAIDCPTCLSAGTPADTDLYGNFPHLSVVRIQGRPVASLPPGDMQYLGWNNAAGQWEPKTVPSALLSSVFGRTGAVLPASGDYTTAQVAESGNLYFTSDRARAALSGAGPIAFNSSTGAFTCPTCITSSSPADTDVSGTFPHLSVVRLQGRPVAATPPADQQYLGWNTSANYWEPKTVPSALVPSVFGRVGPIGAQSGDYSFAQISGTAGASQLPAVAVRTDQSNTVSAGTQDFSRAAHTLPLKSGLAAALPSTCAAAELYFATDAPAGSNVYGCTAANTWAVQGNLTVMSDGVEVGDSGTVDYITGTGLMTVITATGSQINVQTALDTAVVQTQPGEQGGAALLCASGSGSGSAYQCSLSPTLGDYTAGMVLHWIPDRSASGGVTTLDVDTLGPQPVKLPDGVSNPANTDILAGRLYTIWYDGAAFRLPATASTGGGSGGAVASVFGRAGSVTAQSGDYTTAQVTESGSLYFTNARAQSAMSGLYESPLTIGAPLSRTVNAISLPAATAAQNGYLASADWSTFNAKQAVISGAPGSWPSTFAPSGHTASHGYGQGDAVSLDASQIATGLFAMARIPTGTSGSTVALGNHAHTPSQVGLSNVENTAISTWAGSANLATLGTVTTGAWHGTAIGDSYISSAATWNGKQSAITGAPGSWPALGGAALLNVGTTAGTVAAGNDSRFGATSSTSSTPYSCSIANATSQVCAHGLSATQVWVSCVDAGNNALGGTNPSTATAVVGWSPTAGNATNSITVNFSGSEAGRVCQISTGGMGPPGSAGATGPQGSQGIAGGVPATGANGIVACTGTSCSTATTRTLTGTTNHVTVTNGDGISGNPTVNLAAAATMHEVGFSAGDRNSASALTSGTLGNPAVMPFNCTVTGWDASTADGTNVSASVDIWRHASAVPTSSSDSICGSGACPNLTTQQLVVNNTNLTNWANSGAPLLNANDVIVGVLTGLPTAKSVAITLRCAI
jgi:hypothetical protein